jgi:hypothetical protein
MRSFVDLDKTFGDQPRVLGAILSRIDTGRGRERLFEDQLPELLSQLSENARVASITASNAIEGVVLESERAERIAEGSGRSGPGARWHRLAGETTSKRTPGRMRGRISMREDFDEWPPDIARALGISD